MKSILRSLKSITLQLVIAICCLFYTANVGLAQHDHDHSHGSEVVAEAIEDTPLPTSAEGISDKYEVLLKFTPVEPGEQLSMKLFLSDVNSNAPINKANLQLMNVEYPQQSFELSMIENGIYLVNTTMPEEKEFDIDVSIDASIGADLIRLQHIDFTHHHDHAIVDTHKHLSVIWFILGAVLLLIIGIFIGKYISKSGLRRQAMLLLLALLMLPATQLKIANAHEGEEHGPKKKSNSLASEFNVLKESQFLMSVLTQKMDANAFVESRKLYGTIIPAVGGQSVVSSPQAGKVVSVGVVTGQHVNKGQQLAVIERLADAASDVNYAAEKNRYEAEYIAAKKEYERMKALEDIAAKRQLELAKAQLDIAEQNRALYNSGSIKNIILKSPIDGVVGTFTFSSGASVNAEQPLFTITDISTVYVETQAFEKDVELIANASKFKVECTEENHSCDNVKLVSMGQEFNRSNQSQRVIFSFENKNDEFKIGEFVNVWAFGSDSENKMSLPNAAISEMEGRTVAFVKSSAEIYEMRYIAVGETNSEMTIVTKGIQPGDRVVTSGTYQMKLIYLNQ